MRIFYFANIRLPTEKAHGIQIAKNCEALAIHGLEVQLIVPARRNPDFDGADPFEYYGVEKNFEIKTLSVLDPWWLIKGPQGIYIKLQSFLFIISLYFYLRRIVKNEHESAVFYTREEYLLPLLQRFSDRVIWEAHNLPRQKKHYLKYWSKCLKIVAISRGLKEDLVKLGIDADKILVAPDGVDLAKFQITNSKFQTREELGLPTDAKIVMYTGHLYEWKGASLILEVARNTKYVILNTKYVFVGGTEHDLDKFKKMAKGQDNVLILGHKPPKEIPKYLSVADILVLPNSAKIEISNKYTSPLKLFEYMAAGRPIVASYLVSLREILDDTTALFFTPDDPEDLARKIRQILDDEGLGQRLSQNALEKVKNYSWEKRAERILNSI